MNKKIIIVLIILVIGLVLSSPVFAKEKVKVKISTEDHAFKDKAFIVIKLVDSKGRSIHSSGIIHYNITDSHGNYKWAYKPYNGEIRLKYDVGKYKVNVKFDGDSKYKAAKKTKNINLKNKGTLNPYYYYDDHNWGQNPEIDDYIDYNYWSWEIYDDLDDPENEAWDL